MSAHVLWPCAACGRDAEPGEDARGPVGYTLHRDGDCEGPEVPLCVACGSESGPTIEELTEAMAERALYADGTPLLVAWERASDRAEIAHLRAEVNRLTRDRALSSRLGLAPFDALQAIAEHVHGIAREKGWHDGPVDVAAYVANLHGEASELWEAYRAGKLNEPCDKAPRMTEPLTCAEEELADVVIRAMDSAARLGIDIGRAVRVKSAYNQTRTHRHGGKLA